MHTKCDENMKLQFKKSHGVEIFKVSLSFPPMMYTVVSLFTFLCYINCCTTVITIIHNMLVVKYFLLLPYHRDSYS